MIRLIIITIIAAFMLMGYSYYEPQSQLGGLYLNYLHDKKEPGLSSIQDHLYSINGGYIPSSFDSFLFDRLGEIAPDSSEYENIIGFYAHQSLSSRAGSKMYSEDNKIHINKVILLGENQKEINKSKGYLVLAYGMVQKRMLYKPTVNESLLKRCFIKLRGGQLDNNCVAELL